MLGKLRATALCFKITWPMLYEKQLTIVKL